MVFYANMTLLLYLTPSTCYLLSSLYVYGEQSSAVALCREEDTIHLGECGQEDGLKNKKEKKIFISARCVIIAWMYCILFKECALTVELSVCWLIPSDPMTRSIVTRQPCLREAHSHIQQSIVHVRIYCSTDQNLQKWANGLKKSSYHELVLKFFTQHSAATS